MIEQARAYSREPGAFWTDQLNNRHAAAGYGPMGDEIRAQTDGRVDAFVQAVEPAESPPLWDPRSPRRSRQSAPTTRKAMARRCAWPSGWGRRRRSRPCSSTPASST
jgi:hypothetical protein